MYIYILIILTTLPDFVTFLQATQTTALFVQQFCSVPANGSKFCFLRKYQARRLDQSFIHLTCDLVDLKFFQCFVFFVSPLISCFNCDFPWWCWFVLVVLKGVHVFVLDEPTLSFDVKSSCSHLGCSTGLTSVPSWVKHILGLSPISETPNSKKMDHFIMDFGPLLLRHVIYSHLIWWYCSGASCLPSGMLEG